MCKPQEGSANRPVGGRVALADRAASDFFHACGPPRQTLRSTCKVRWFALRPMRSSPALASSAPRTVRLTQRSGQCSGAAPVSRWGLGNSLDWPRFRSSGKTWWVRLGPTYVCNNRVTCFASVTLSRRVASTDMFLYQLLTQCGTDPLIRSQRPERRRSGLPNRAGTPAQQAPAHLNTTPPPVTAPSRPPSSARPSCDCPTSLSCAGGGTAVGYRVSVYWEVDQGPSWRSARPVLRYVAPTHVRSATVARTCQVGSRTGLPAAATCRCLTSATREAT